MSIETQTSQIDEGLNEIPEPVLEEPSVPELPDRETNEPENPDAKDIPTGSDDLSSIVQKYGPGEWKQTYKEDQTMSLDNDSGKWRDSKGNFITDIIGGDNNRLSEHQRIAGELQSRGESLVEYKDSEGNFCVTVIKLDGLDARSTTYLLGSQEKGLDLDDDEGQIYKDIQQDENTGNQDLRTTEEFKVLDLNQLFSAEITWGNTEDESEPQNQDDRPGVFDAEVISDQLDKTLELELSWSQEETNSAQEPTSELPSESVLNFDLENSGISLVMEGEKAERVVEEQKVQLEANQVTEPKVVPEPKVAELMAIDASYTEAVKLEPVVLETERVTETNETVINDASTIESNTGADNVPEIMEVMVEKFEPINVGILEPEIEKPLEETVFESASENILAETVEPEVMQEIVPIEIGFDRPEAITVGESLGEVLESTASEIVQEGERQILVQDIVEPVVEFEGKIEETHTTEEVHTEVRIVQNQEVPEMLPIQDNVMGTIRFVEAKQESPDPIVAESKKLNAKMEITETIPEAIDEMMDLEPTETVTPVTERIPMVQRGAVTASTTDNEYDEELVRTSKQALAA